MHDSMPRLLNYARDATRGKHEAITDFRSLGERLGESSATISNWKSRGISKEGALKAEREFGCSAVWLLDGTGEPGSAKPQEDLMGALMIVASALAKSDRFAREWRKLSIWFAEIIDEPSNFVTFAHKLKNLYVVGQNPASKKEDAPRGSPTWDLGRNPLIDYDERNPTQKKRANGQRGGT